MDAPKRPERTQAPHERRREALAAALRELREGGMRAGGTHTPQDHDTSGAHGGNIDPPHHHRGFTPRERRTAPQERRRNAEHELIDEIAIAAERLASARDWHGDPVYRSDGIWRVLATVGSSPYCLAIADLARALGVRRQVAHDLAHAAERAGVVELASNPQDKRILQALLTPRGRAELAAVRTTQAIWRATVLNGLGDREMAATTHVVRVIRQRLERDARELAERNASR
jgi:DNA-binding MarR family transcriptional regulator